jgi:hypothetical protein
MTRIFILFSLFFSFTLRSQDIAIGEWKEHLSYKNAISVAEGNGKVYCATTSGVFFLNKGDNSMERLTKVNGLSDVEPCVINFNPYDNKVLIAYKNSNIDIIENSTITNISDIKRKSIIGNKAINNIYFIGSYAYLSCGFGIVVIDMDRLEVKDTYYIGAGGAALNVRDLTTDATNFYAATDAGVYRASLTNPNLANYTAWGPMTGVGLPNGIYNTITTFNGKIYTNFSKSLMSAAFLQDSIFVYDNSVGGPWTHFTPEISGYIVKSLRVGDNQLVITKQGYIYTYDATLTIQSLVYTYFGDEVRANAAVMDNSAFIWIADSKYGLVKNYFTWQNWSYYPNGPGSPNVDNMSLEKNKLWVAPGGVNNSWQNLLFADGVYAFEEDDWKNISGNYAPVVKFDTVLDIMNVLVDPNNAAKVYAATWGQGIYEFQDDVPVKHYNKANSSLQQISSNHAINIYGLAMDESANLWVTNSGVKYSISVKDPNGVWDSIDFSNVIGNNPDLGQILIDKTDQKWVVLTRGAGLMVYKGATRDNANSSNAKKLSTAIGNGALPSIGVYCLAEDTDGEIWVGTDKGITIFFSPENVFTGQNFDAQQVLLEQDGHVQILLETETVQAIAVDDANRKWIATAKSGVFLMSSDGTKQIYHFDENNSPLFSNDVRSIAINHETGEVYFGTSKGIVSYRGTAVAGQDSFTDVYSYPNPVKPDYDGPIAIKGLVTNTTVKITDISGTLVYETKSEGGQAIWYGKNFKGEKVSTGVYMVFCTSEDGSKKIATKILFIN